VVRSTAGRGLIVFVAARECNRLEPALPLLGSIEAGAIQGCVVDERRKQWNFMMTEGGWIWRLMNADGTEQTSRAFKTLKECTEDAAKHGYVVWKSEAERRRES
jgi:hypothetical protein